MKMRRALWLSFLALLGTLLVLGSFEFAFPEGLPSGAPNVHSQEWRMVAAKILHIKHQGRDEPHPLFAERYLDAMSQNEAELRYDMEREDRPLMAILWGSAASERWEHFFVDRGYIVCVNKQHVIPANPKPTGVWYDIDGPEAEACRTLSEA